MTTDELDELVSDAEHQGQLRAYIYPRFEICGAGNLYIETLDEWNVPKSKIDKLRGSLGAKIENTEGDDLRTARGALRDIFEECDSWQWYTEHYEEKMGIFTRILFAATAILGPVDKPRPDADASEQDESDEAGGELVISGGDTPLLLEMPNKTLNP